MDKDSNVFVGLADYAVGSPWLYEAIRNFFIAFDGFQKLNRPFGRPNQSRLISSTTELVIESMGGQAETGQRILEDWHPCINQVNLIIADM